MIKIQKNILLSKFTNYRIGGPAKYFIRAKNEVEIKEGIKWAKSKKLKIFILGGGTNLLVSDKGFNGLVLKVGIRHLNFKGLRVHAGAGVLMKDLNNLAIKNKLSGLEWAGGLPGTLGGAIRGNAGAFRGEIKDNIESVQVLNVKTLKSRICLGKQCDFSYRTSFFKKHDNEEIILSATLKLAKGDQRKIKIATEDKIKFRKSRHPLEYPNSGSVFKNIPLDQIIKKNTLEYNESVRQSSFNLRGITAPVKNDPFPVIPTAFLISEAGLKGRKSGGAMISQKHPNFIVNINHAKAKDVLSLIKLAKTTLRRKFGVKAEEEVQIIK